MNINPILEKNSTVYAANIEASIFREMSYFSFAAYRVTDTTQLVTTTTTKTLESNPRFESIKTGIHQQIVNSNKTVTHSYKFKMPNKKSWKSSCILKRSDTIEHVKGISIIDNISSLHL